MSRLPRTLAVTLAAIALAAPAAWAAESASSASSVASSASVGSVSASVERSSASSSPGGQRAEGAYRVIEVADAADRPGRVRVQLRAVAGDDAFALLLPAETAARAALAAGVVVEARAREHGWQFLVAGEPFFLVVDDDRIDDLARRQVRG
jgi:hypothetical protein